MISTSTGYTAEELYSDFIEKYKEELCMKIEERRMSVDSDNVTSPKHYTLDGLNIESKDVFKNLLGKELYLGWLWGNALKYLFRWKKKNGLEDLKKCSVYLNWMIDIMEND